MHGMNNLVLYGRIIRNTYRAYRSVGRKLIVWALIYHRYHSYRYGPDLSITNLEHVAFKKHQPTLFNHFGRERERLAIPKEIVLHFFVLLYHAHTVTELLDELIK